MKPHDISLRFSLGSFLQQWTRSTSLSLHFLYLVYLIGLCFALFSLPCAAQSTRHCRNLFQQKAYQRAGQCFLQKARAMGLTSKSGNQTAHWNKGRLVLTAARIFSIAGKQFQSSRPPLSRKLFWRSFQAYKQYIQEAMYESSQRRASAKQQYNKLKRQLQLGTIQLKAPSSDARICIRSKWLKLCRTQLRWTALVPPGTYRIIASQPGHVNKEKRTTLRAFGIRSISFRATNKAGNLRITSSPLGAVVQLDGINRGRTPLTLTLPSGKHILRLTKDCYQENEQALQTTTSRNKLHVVLRFKPTPPASTGNQGAGWSVLIAGSVLAIGGGIAFAMLPGQLTIKNEARAQYEDRNIKRTQKEFDALIKQEQDATNSANAMIGLGTAGAILGAAGIITGIYLLASPTKAKPSKCQRLSNSQVD